MTENQKSTNEEQDQKSINYHQVVGPVFEKSQEEIIEEIRNSSEAKENSVNLALHIQEKVSKNWFTLNRLISKTGMDRNQAIQKLHVLKIFDLVLTKMGEFKDGKKSNNLPVFKITISIEDRVSALDSIISYHQQYIDQASREKAVLLSDKLQKKLDALAEEQEKQNNQPV